MRREGLTDADYNEAARLLGCDAAAIRAVAEVESAGRAFYPDGYPVILFERHVFSRLTGGRFDSTHPTISNPKPGGYGRAGANQRRRFSAAFNLDPDAAMQATSWGRFQILGLNYRRAGFKSVGEFVDAMKRSEREQLLAFVRFILSSPTLTEALRKHDWAAFAREYNGPAYRKNRYDVKLAEAYQKFSGKTLQRQVPADASTVPSGTTDMPRDSAPADTAPVADAVESPPAEVAIPKERPSLFTRISAAITAFVGFVTMLGISLGTLITEKLRDVPAEWFFAGLAGVVLIALAIWWYDRSAERANRLNQKLIEAAADQRRATVRLEKKGGSDL